MPEFHFGVKTRSLTRENESSCSRDVVAMLDTPSLSSEFGRFPSRHFGNIPYLAPVFHKTCETATGIIVSPYPGNRQYMFFSREENPTTMGNLHTD